MILGKKEALNRAMNICSRSEKTAKDIRQSLTKWGLSSVEDQLSIIEYLKENNFIDETRYSISFARDKHKFNRWGKIKILNMLRAKAIDEQTIKEALNNIDDESYLVTLREELIKKRKSVKASNQYDLKVKLLRFASSRGFETDLIYKVLEELLKS
jgi:regulatory protein